MQATSKANIDNWLRENEYSYGNLAVKRQDKPKQPQQAARTPWHQRMPQDRFRPVFQLLVWCHDHLAEVARMAIASTIGVVLGLLFVWAW